MKTDVKYRVRKESLFATLLILCFFFIGFRFLFVGLALVLVCLVLLLFLYRFDVRVHLAALVVSIFYVLYSLFGVSNYEDGGVALLRHSVIFMLPSLMFLYLGSLNRLGDILSYAVISLVFSYSVVLYSYLNGYAGYGELYNFFSGGLANSPTYVILILISTFICCERLRSSANFFGYLISFFLLAASFVACSVYMQSRFSLLALAAYIVYMIGFNIKFAAFFSVILAVLVMSMDEGLAGILNSLSRANNSGLDSPRWLMWEYGFVEMFNKPLGGIKAYESGTGYQGIWFHNIYLDIARVSGLFVVFYWIAIQIAFTVIACFSLDKKSLKLYLMVFLFLSLAVFQDIAFEGFYNYMLYFFYIFGLALSRGGRRISSVLRLEHK